jgi:outer membrane protein assembly factor BamB
LLVVRVVAVAAVVALTVWAAHRTGSVPFLAFLLVLPAVAVADLLVSWWRRPRFFLLVAALALAAGVQVLSVYRHDEQVSAPRASRPAASTLGHDRILWRAPVAGVGGVAAGPVAAGGRVVYAGYDGEVHALDPRDGSTLWSAPGFVPGDRELAVAGNLVLVPGTTLVALDARTGKARWRLSAPAGVGTPVVVGGVVVVPRELGGLAGLDARNGRRIWSRSEPRFVQQLAAAGRRVAACDEGRRLVLDPKTGRTLATAAAPCGYVPTPGLPGVTLQPRGAHGIAAVDTRTSRELWRVYLPGYAPGAPQTTASGPLVYVPWKDETASPVTGGIRAYDMVTGKERWLVDIGGGVSARPLLVDNRLVVAGDLDCGAEPCGAAIYGLRP